MAEQFCLAAGFFFRLPLSHGLDESATKQITPSPFSAASDSAAYMEDDTEMF